MIVIFANFVLILHFLIVVFVTFGFFLVPIGYKFKWQWVQNIKLRAIHCILISFVTLETLIGMTCPLTIIESNLRDINEPKSFVNYWISEIIYWNFPKNFFLILYILLLLWTFVMWKIFPPSKKTK